MDSTEPIRGLVHISSEVRAGQNWEDKSVVELKFFFQNVNRTEHSVIVVDRGTAAKLIRQLQKALDDSYNDMINQRAGGSDDYR